MICTNPHADNPSKLLCRQATSLKMKIFSLPWYLAMAMTIVSFSLASSVSIRAQEIPLNLSEEAALLELRSDLGIRSHYWPRGANPCTSWTGILCENGHVISIHLSGLRRTVKRALHPSLALNALQKFPSLHSINASGFPLPGSLPPWLGRLSKLELLDFTSSFLQGSILSSISILSYLQVLILAHNNLTGNIPTSLVELKSLTVLDISSNALTGEFPANVVQLQSLRILSLNSNNLRGHIPAGLGSLKSLQVLDLANNQLNGSVPPQLGNLFHLTTLNLSFNALSGWIPPELGNLSSLNTMSISHNTLSGPIPAELTLCRGLQVLMVQQNSLTGKLPTSIGSFQTLSNLNLSFNRLTGILPEGISTLSEIRAIGLSHNNFYGPLPVGINRLLAAGVSDVSYNFLSGNVSGPPINNAMVQANCFSGAVKQRPLKSCMEFYSKRGLFFQGPTATLSLNNQQQGVSEDGVSKRKPLDALLAGVFGGLGMVLIIIFIVLLVSKQERKVDSGGIQSVAPGKLDLHTITAMTSLCLGEKFSFAQLMEATGGFNSSNLIKDGHSGELYRGFLDGVSVVVKKIVMSDAKKGTLLKELDLFEKASHTRLVPLLGYCLDLEEQKFLVYKSMANRDLACVLQRKAGVAIPHEDSLQSLDWITRLKIAIGAAEGLVYLHHECSPPIVHRDVQASSILLDDQFEVRLGSLSGASTGEGETHHGMMACLFRMSYDQADPGAPVPACSYDVYCFGKVLLQLITGKAEAATPSDTSGDSWLEWALPLISIYDKESIGKVVDPSLILDEDLVDEVWAMAIVAKSCLNPKPSKRPLMRHVLKALENPLKVVRDDAVNDSLRSRNSSHGSWNNAVFGSWHHNLSETVILPGSLREEHLNKSSSRKHPDNGGSQGSAQSEVSRRRHGSSEIFPEPADQSMVVEPNINQ